MTTENNKIIAEFMGFELQVNPNERWLNNWFIKDTLNTPWLPRIELLHFDTDWNWLIEVVQRVEQLPYNKTLFREVVKVTALPISTTKEEVYNACIEFIKWYNLNK